VRQDDEQQPRVPHTNPFGGPGQRGMMVRVQEGLLAVGSHTGNVRPLGDAEGDMAADEPGSRSDDALWARFWGAAPRGVRMERGTAKPCRPVLTGH
jgi:hypothetical protein